MMKKRQFITAEDGKQLKKKKKEIATVMNTPPPPFDYIFIDKLFKKFG